LTRAVGIDFALLAATFAVADLLEPVFAVVEPFLDALVLAAVLFISSGTPAVCAVPGEVELVVEVEELFPVMLAVLRPVVLVPPVVVDELPAVVLDDLIDPLPLVICSWPSLMLTFAAPLKVLLIEVDT
jgi:hypothetical protein